MLTIDQIVEANPVDRVGCPVCSQRRQLNLDCHCCGGLGYVDCDDVFETLSETLADCCHLERHAPNWIAVGFYVALDGSYVVLPNRTVDFVTDDQAAMAFRVSQAANRPSLFVRFMAWILRGAA